MSLRSTAKDPHPELAVAVSVSRFWHLVAIGDADDCWPWGGYSDDDGYGVFQFNGRRRGAHELALSFATGERRAEGMDTRHACDNPPCCNPAHLTFGTRLENVRDMYERGRAARQGRLTDAQVEEMRVRRANGARQKDLARDYGITDGQVSMIVRGLRWPDAPGPIEGRQAQYKKGA